MNRSILFVGSFLSAISGTMGISEKLVEALSNENSYKFHLASRKKSKYFRFFDILSSSTLRNYDLAHIDVFSGLAFYYALFASAIMVARRKPFICTLRGGMLPEFAEKHPKIINYLLSRSNKTHTPSLYLKEHFENRGYLISYLPNYLHLEKFPYFRSNAQKGTILWVRAFDPIYNPHIAVECLFHVKKVFPQAKLTMIGPDKGILYKIRSLIEERGLESSVLITGSIPNTQLYHYYHQHAVFINTTSYESFGQAVIEAAACGIPIVSTPAGEIPLLWKEEEEILITKDWSPESMAEAVIRILKDQELSSVLSQNARKKAELFDWKNIKIKWLELLENN